MGLCHNSLAGTLFYFGYFPLLPSEVLVRGRAWSHDSHKSVGSFFVAGRGPLDSGGPAAGVACGHRAWADLGYLRESVQRGVLDAEHVVHLPPRFELHLWRRSWSLRLLLLDRTST